jgi:hypothetical protein
MMNIDVEDLLRSGMERLTDQVQVPRGLAERAVAAHRRHRRRVVGAIAAGSATVATAVLFAVTGAGLAPARTAPGGAGVHTVDYVLSRVVGALSSSDAVVQTRTTFDPAYPAITQWSYRGHYRSVQSGRFREPGAPWAQGEESWAFGTATQGAATLTVGVDYRHQRWYKSPPILPGKALNGCSNTLGLLQYGTGPVDWTLYVRQALHCGKFRVAGHGQLDGHRVIELTGWERRPSFLGHNALYISATLYVDASTYMPLRVTWVNRSHTPAGFVPLYGVVRQDLSLLSPSRRHVALTTITIPAGFRQVPTFTFGGPMYQFFGTPK